jgi:hypothetical protein
MSKSRDFSNIIAFTAAAVPSFAAVAAGFYAFPFIEEALLNHEVSETLSKVDAFGGAYGVFYTASTVFNGTVLALKAAFDAAAHQKFDWDGFTKKKDVYVAGQWCGILAGILTSLAVSYASDEVIDQSLNQRAQEPTAITLALQ